MLLYLVETPSEKLRFWVGALSTRSIWHVQGGAQWADGHTALEPMVKAGAGSKHSGVSVQMTIQVSGSIRPYKEIPGKEKRA